jgi:hypothetical protein
MDTEERESQERNGKSNREQQEETGLAERISSQGFLINHPKFKKKIRGKNRFLRNKQKHIYLGVVFSIPSMQGYGLQVQLTIHIDS